ncbi:MAG TPA: hypothetical protein VN026_18340 [Bacteroidia bacterium]|jgi:hypothetical protein|nr:hypothetical protein [Bacteroidia bacterium]
MAEETQYTANTGIVQISTANAGLDGSGTLGTVLTGASNGTLVKSVIIKAITNVTEGMIRLFIDDNNGTKELLYEVVVPAITKASINKAFETRINLDFFLKSGYILKAATQNNETFNVIAEGMDCAYYSNGVRMDTTKYTANTGSVVIATANSNLNGTGTLGLAYTAGASATYNGSSVGSITIKSSVSDSPGMIRLYLDNLTTKFCFAEVVVPTRTKSSTDQAFEHTIVFDNDFELQAGYKIQASTEIGESYHVMVEGNDWNYYS